MRAIRVYPVPPHERRGETIEMVFHDSEGSRIHAEMKTEHVQRFRGEIKEGLVYALRYFSVKNNLQSYKTTYHPCSLVFKDNTLIIKQGEEGFPDFSFNFQPFEKLLAAQKLDNRMQIGTMLLSRGYGQRG